MAKTKRRSECFALFLVLLTLGEEDPDTQDSPNTCLYEVRFDKVIGFCDKDLSQSFGRGDQYPIAIEEMTIPNETIVGYLIYPLPHRNTGGLLDNLVPLAHEEGIIAGFRQVS